MGEGRTKVTQFVTPLFYLFWHLLLFHMPALKQKENSHYITMVPRKQHCTSIKLEAKNHTYVVLKNNIKKKSGEVEYMYILWCDSLSIK